MEYLRAPGAWLACNKLKDKPRKQSYHRKRKIMLGTVLVVLLVLMLLGSLPTWPHSRNWGYGPTGGLGVVLTILIILLLLGKI
jgi:hypothetical protein